MKRLLHAAVLCALVCTAAVPAGAQSAKTTLTDPVEAQLFNDVSDRLMCQCGCQMILRVCNHQNCPSGIPMRREIERQITAGTGEEEIVQSFVDEHGMKILSSPPVEGFNLAAWIMPGFALLIGLLIVVHFAGSQLTRRRAVTSAAAGLQMDPAMKDRIERELEAMER